MRPTHLSLRGVTRYDELDLDLTTLPLGLIAVVGPNGEGKTTLLECMAPAPLFLELPSRPGPLKDWTRGRDARIELTLEHGGSEFRVLVQVDPEYSAGRGKTEAFLFQDGEPMNDGKVRTFRAAIAKAFPSRPIFLASAFASQTGTGAWSKLTVVERKELFAELLGLGRLQELADRAKEHRKIADSLLVDHERDVEELARKEDRAIELRAEIENVGHELPSLADLTLSREEDLRKTKDTLRDLEERAGATSKLRDELRALEAKLVELRARVKTDRDLVESLPDLVAAVERRARYVEQGRTSSEDLRRLETEISTRGRERAQAQEDRDRTARELRQVRESLPHVARGQDRLADLERQLVALEIPSPEEVVELQGRVRKDEEAARTAKAELDRLTRDRDDASRKAELLERVPCKGNTFYLGNPLDDAEAVDCGSCDFLVEARNAAAVVADLVDAVESQGLRVLETAGELAASREEAARHDELARKAQDLGVELRKVRAWLEAHEGDEARGDELQARLEELDARIETATEAKGQAHQDRDLALERQSIARTKLQGTEGVDARLQAARTAEAALPGREELLVERETRAGRLQSDLEGQEEVPAEEVARASRDVQEATADLNRARVRRRDLDRELGRLRGLLEALGDLKAQRKALTKRAGGLERRRAAFRLVEQGLGRNGVQALEIDAAGPEVSEHTNTLLQSLVAGRFQVALRTVQEATGSRKAKEVFDLDVYDSLRGRTGGLAGLSGGEKVVNGEALKLALAVFNAGKWGAPLRTLWRDECDGALDPVIRPRYPAMLRAALKLGGFDRVFFVTHDRGVAEQADGILWVEGGTARLIEPGEWP